MQSSYQNLHNENHHMRGDKKNLTQKNKNKIIKN